MKRTVLIAVAGLVLVGPLAGCQSESEKLLTEGVSLYEAGQLDKARKKLETAVDHLPADSKALFYLARVYHAQGFYEQAIFYYQCCLSSVPCHAEAMKHLREATEAAGPAGPVLRIIPDLEE